MKIGLFITMLRKLYFVVIGLLVVNLSVEAGSREQAKRMHDRIAGVPPSASVLNSMEADIALGNAISAAETAMKNPAFYNVTLKNMITPWTNEEQTVFAALNDYTATVIGIVRDDLDFRLILSDDIIYVGDDALGLPAYSNSNNAHYEAMEQNGVDLSTGLVKRDQSLVTGLPVDATAGVMTTRAAAKAFFVAGTNRAMFRFTLLNHFCNDLEQIKDATRPADRIRQDVSRSPGGDSRIFLNACVGCHAGMDPMAQAFAYYEYEYDSENDPDAENGALVYNDVGMIDADTGTRVQKKYHINGNNFKFGYKTPDDRWDNYWRQGPNFLLGWDTNDLDLPEGGNGAKSLGVELANSEAFAVCQVKKVFQTVCLRQPIDTDMTAFGNIVTSFKSNNYNLKQVFAETADHCKGD